MATPALGAAKLYHGYYLISSTVLSWYIPKPTQPIIKTPTVLDIFSGAGGMSLGFQNAGCEILGGIDNNPHAVRTHNINFPKCKLKIKAQDIRAINLNAIKIKPGEVDILIGGSPCQVFSVVGIVKMKALGVQI